MKKIFALALAAVMTAGMTTVAFADNEGVYIDSSTKYYKLGSDNRAEDTSADEFEGGDQLVIPVSVYEDSGSKKGEYDTTDKALGYLTHASDYDRNVTVNHKWKVGKDLGVKVDVDWVNYSKVNNLSTGDSQIMSVIITLPENETTKVEDLAGTIRVGRTASTAKKGPEFKLDISFFSDATKKSNPDFDGGELKSGKTGIVSFEKEAGEIDIDFEDVATFTVDVDGQGKLNLAWNTKFDTNFGDMYNYANLHFFTFEGTPAFNKTGTMMVYADKGTFFYEATADGAKEIDADYNEDYEAWVFKTRKLTSYVVSDVELTDKTVTEDNSSSTTNGGKDNPDTGR